MVSRFLGYSHKLHTISSNGKTFSRALENSTLYLGLDRHSKQVGLGLGDPDNIGNAPFELYSQYFIYQSVAEAACCFADEAKKIKPCVLTHKLDALIDHSHHI